MQIEKIPVAKLKAAEYNPRRRSSPVTRNTKSSSAALRNSVMWSQLSGINRPATWSAATSG